LLPALLAGELGRPAVDAIDRHVAGCPACREARLGLAADRALLRELPVPEPGPWLAARVMAAVRAGAMPRTSLRPGWMRAAVAAAMTLFVASAVWAGVTVGADLADRAAGNDPLAVNGETELTEYIDGSLGSGR
jgi:predicted anti-sigma-YlaC factor YlaD